MVSSPLLRVRCRLDSHIPTGPVTFLKLLNLSGLSFLIFKMELMIDTVVNLTAWL